jgi:hypothetical protein
MFGFSVSVSVKIQFYYNWLFVRHRFAARFFGCRDRDHCASSDIVNWLDSRIPIVVSGSLADARSPIARFVIR